MSPPRSSVRGPANARDQCCAGSDRGRGVLPAPLGPQRIGFNSDEAVYAGQAASIADHPELKEFFPTFRAHPLLFQTILSVGYHLGGYDLFGRVVSAVFGVATVFLVYKAGKILYGTSAGLIAALFMALMPYHVVVTRQVLLDGRWSSSRRCRSASS